MENPTLGVWLGKIDIWWDSPVFQGHRRFDKACNARSAFGMADIWFHLRCQQLGRPFQKPTATC